MLKKSLNIRVSLAEHDLIQSAAKEKSITPSALVRSLAITAISNKYEPLTPSPSPSPNLDKLSFESRKKLLSLLDICVEQLLNENFTTSQIETTFLIGMGLAFEDFQALFLPA
jgi:hypothetical protein